MRGDFGKSFISQRDVVSEIFNKDRIGTSFFVAAVATVFEFLIAIPLGITAATHQYSARDYVVTVLVLIGISLPSFFFGQLLKDIFANKLGWFPVSGMKDAGVTYANAGEMIADYLHHMFLPILTVVILSIGSRMRMTRTNMLEVMNSDYIRTARAKGLSEWAVIVKHGLRNALIPVVTMMGLQFGFLLGGSIVVEKVFNWPGLGRLLVDAVEMRDYPVLQAEVLLFSLEFILINLLVDILYAVINPRICFK